LIASVFYPVEALLEFPPTFLFRQFGYGFGGCLRGFPDPAPGEEELVPPDPAAFEERHLCRRPFRA
jgi:hypothetical protein